MGEGGLAVAWMALDATRSRKPSASRHEAHIWPKPGAGRRPAECRTWKVMSGPASPGPPRAAGLPSLPGTLPPLYGRYHPPRLVAAAFLQLHFASPTPPRGATRPIWFRTARFLVTRVPSHREAGNGRHWQALLRRRPGHRPAVPRHCFVLLVAHCLICVSIYQ